MTLSYSLAKKRPSSLSIGLSPIFFLQSGKPMGAEPLTRGICFSLLYQPAWRKVTFTHGEQIWVDHRSSIYGSLREPVLCYNLLFLIPSISQFMAYSNDSRKSVFRMLGVSYTGYSVIPTGPTKPAPAL